MADLNKIEKKLAQLKAAKEKEEKKLKDNVDKLTAKYNEDQKNLKTVFDTKVSEVKEESASKISRITPEIDFLEKQKKEMIKLEAQLEKIRKNIDDRMLGGKESSEKDVDEFAEFSAESEK